MTIKIDMKEALNIIADYFLNYSNKTQCKVTFMQDKNPHNSHFIIEQK